MSTPEPSEKEREPADRHDTLASGAKESPSPLAADPAQADPLAAAAAGILSHMNADHADTLLAYARALAGEPLAEAAEMTGIDRLGFEMRVKTPSGEKRIRLGFDDPVTTTDEVRRAMIALARAAREKTAPPGV